MLKAVFAHIPLPRLSGQSGGLIRRFMGSYLAPHRKQLAVAMVCMMLSSGCYGLFAHLLEPLIDKILGTSDNTLLILFPLGLVGLFFVRGVSEYVYNFLMDTIGQKTVAQLQKEMYSKLVYQDLYFMRHHSAASLVSRFLFDLQRLRQTISQTVTGSVRDTTMVVALLINLFDKDWLLSIFALFVFPPIILSARRFGRRTRKYATGIQTTTGQLSSILNETFQGIRQVHVYTMEEQEKKRVSATVDKTLALMVKNTKIKALTSPLVEFVAMVNFAGVVVYAVLQVREGHLSQGAFISFITTLLLMYRPLKGLSNMNNTIQEGLSVMARTFQILDTPTHIHNKVGAQKLQVTSGRVVFNHVSFKYPDGQLAIKELNLEIPAGKTVALVGASGAGKSTILNMIPRFYDPTAGSITIDGQVVKDVTLQSLRQHIALVTQDVVLFNDTIYNNIAYGNPTATEAQVVAAAKAAAADGFIRKLEGGYAAMVGENGARLSGGQRQRVAIARALLKNAPILLLDEATSSLDTESERQVQKALKHLMQGRTTLVVAHRLSTVADADVIHVLEHGEIVESGTHPELLAKGGIYTNLYTLQQTHPDDDQKAPATTTAPSRSGKP